MAARATPQRRGLTLAELWTVVAIGLPVLGSLIAPMSTVDLAYQIRTGQLMLESGSILAADPFTFTVGGEPWLNQQWAAGLLFGWVFDVAGWAGLSVLRALLIGLTFGLVLLTCRAAGARPRTAALLTIAAFGVSVTSLGLRAQLLGLLLFAATLAVLALRRRHPWLLWLLPLVFIAWANVHGSFVIGLAAVGAALLADVVDRNAGWRHLAGALALCVAATLVNPWIAGVWVYALSLTTSSQITRLITEWQPTSLRNYTGIAFVASALAMTALLIRRGRSVGWPTLGWLAALFVVGLYAERGVAWWALGAAPVAAMMLAVPREPQAEGGAVVDTAVADAPSGRHAEPRRPLNLLLAFGLLVAIVVALPVWRGGDARFGPDGMLLDAPPGVTRVLLERATTADRLFAAQAWASWFELAVPGVLVMVDSRIELFPGDVWADYLAASIGRQDWPQILDRWGVTMVALERDSGRGLVEFLSRSPQWTASYEDDEGVVFVRADRPRP